MKPVWEICFHCICALSQFVCSCLIDTIITSFLWIIHLVPFQEIARTLINLDIFIFLRILFYIADTKVSWFVFFLSNYNTKLFCGLFTNTPCNNFLLLMNKQGSRLSFDLRLLYLLTSWKVFALILATRLLIHIVIGTRAGFLLKHHEAKSFCFLNTVMHTATDAEVG